ncbi:MAG: ribosome small subunit-dependent GTPase A [Treponemataceae bacterium]|nr:ribosome small subunit-dependent GTPase A [Treponemataceae bacterium]
MTGTIIRCSKNSFLVESDEKKQVMCEIKGKILKASQGFYNPLAPGDRVVFEVGADNGRGRILELLPRRTTFTRFNQKGDAPQVIAANIDLLCCVTTAEEPPFRPRFIDRVLVQAEIAHIPAAIIVNKIDQEILDQDALLDMEERLSDFVRIGYPVFRVSAATGAGLGELTHHWQGKRVLLVGQSGVGKSSLINALGASPPLKVGALSAKYQRGSHTTTVAQMILCTYGGNTFWVLDTPGIRRLTIDGITTKEVALYFKEFAPLIGQCSYGLSCSHRFEVGCKILEALSAGYIHEDRYESFQGIVHELAEHSS